MGCGPLLLLRREDALHDRRSLVTGPADLFSTPYPPLRGAFPASRRRSALRPPPTSLKLDPCLSRARQVMIGARLGGNRGGRGAAIRPEFPSQHFENTHFALGMLRQLPKRFRREPARHAQAAQRPAPKGAGLGRERFSTWPRGTRQPIENARFMHRSCFPWSPFCFPRSPFSFPWSPSSFPWRPSSFPVGSRFLLPSSSCTVPRPNPAPARAFHPPGNPNARA